jgi:hypothetical protein
MRKTSTAGYFLAEMAGFGVALYALLYVIGYSGIKAVFYVNLISSLFDISQSVIDPKTG